MTEEPPRTPPVAVIAAAYLFAGVAALALTVAVAALFAVPEFSHHASARAGDSAAGELAAVRLTGFALLAFAFGAVCLLPAYLNGRRRSSAGTLTWVVGGLSGCLSLGLLAVRTYDSVPWYGGMTRIGAVGMLLLTIASAALLALPASHRYFRLTRSTPQRHHPWPAPTPLLAPPAYAPPPSAFPPPVTHAPPPPGFPPPAGYPPPLPPSPPPPPPLHRGPRPVAVTAAMATLLCMVILAIGSAVVEILTYQAVVGKLETYQRAMQEFAGQLGVNVAFPRLPSAAAGPTVTVVAALVAITVALGVLAFAIRSPRPRARITALVVVGLLALLATARAITTMTTEVALQQIAAQSERLRESMGAGDREGFPFLGVSEIYPQWSYSAVYLSSALAVFGCVTVFVLLNLRSSTTWFSMAEGHAHRQAPPPYFAAAGHLHQPAPASPAPGNDAPGTGPSPTDRRTDGSADRRIDEGPQP